MDDVIEKTEAVIEQLQAVKKAMMQELLTRGLPGRHTRFKQTEVGEIPMDWEVVLLGDVFKLTSGKGISVRSLGPKTDLITIPVFGGNGLVGYHNVALVEDEVVTIGRVGEYCGAVHRTGGPAWISDNALYTKDLKRPVDVGFLAAWLGWLNLARFRKKTGQPLVTQKPIHDLKAALPPAQEQRDIADRLAVVGDRISTEGAALEQIKAIKASLMSVLLTGERRVTPDEGTA